MNILQKEKVSAYTHGALIPVMIAGTIVLVILAGKNIKLQFFTLIYGLSAIILFTASFLYHARKKSENERSVWRKLDRSAIFVLIAGTSAPLCFLYLKGSMMWWVLAVQWLLVLSGIAFSFFINAPRKISTLIYLLMGWVVVIPFKSMFAVMPPSIIILLFAGGVSYIAGAIVYAIKKPNPLPPHMGFHEVFHVFVIGGAVLHLCMVIGGVSIYIQS
jgi:hemolysin III